MPEYAKTIVDHLSKLPSYRVVDAPDGGYNIEYGEGGPLDPDPDRYANGASRWFRMRSDAQAVCDKQNAEQKSNG